MFVINLVSTESPSLYEGNYSNKIFLEGKIEVNTLNEVEEIKNKFLNKGIIYLYQNFSKYSEDIFSDSLIEINIKDFFYNRYNEKIRDTITFNRSCHSFGEGYTFCVNTRTSMERYKSQYGYKYHFWLEISKKIK